ncbi:hypothetical protein K474DRAFT_1710790 [Panus rudis PR-1116 ss-1]|nr:hypothetical protein K474DRAFT_1710790 [Panus rudis PR-1116 ss-1]
MTDWSSPAAIASELHAYVLLIHAIAGLYFWEFLLSLNFDFTVIYRYRTFRWPMVFYYLNRYSALATIIVMIWIVDASASREINCSGPITTLQVFFFMSLLLASINLSLRTIALWSLNRYITASLVILLLGQLAIMTQIRIGGEWIPGEGCVPAEVPNRFVAALHFYPMAFDLLVLILAIWKLRAFSARTFLLSQLGPLLIRDGLLYYLISLSANIVVVVLDLLNLNAFMNSMFNIPAAMLMSVAATRVVRNLYIQASKGGDIFSIPKHRLQPTSSTRAQFTTNIVSVGGNISTGPSGDGDTALPLPVTSKF